MVLSKRQSIIKQKDANLKQLRAKEIALQNMVTEKESELVQTNRQIQLDIDQ